MDSRPQIDIVLEMLRRGPCTTSQFLEAYIPRFADCIFRLRQQGHNIKTDYQRRGSYLYTLNEKPQGELFGGGDIRRSMSEVKP